MEQVQPVGDDEYERPGDEDDMDEDQWTYHRSPMEPKRESRAMARTKGVPRKEMKPEQVAPAELIARNA